MLSRVEDRSSKLVDRVAAEETEGEAGRVGALEIAVAVIRIAPAAGRHAFIDELCGSRKVGIQLRTRSRRAAAGLCAGQNLRLCGGIVAQRLCRNGNSGGRGCGQNSHAVFCRGALDIVAVFVGHIAAVGVLRICPVERSAADNDAVNQRPVTDDQREAIRIVAVRGRVFESCTVEVHTLDVVVHLNTQSVTDCERGGGCGAVRESVNAQCEDHHNCQKDCCELFHSSFLLLYFPGSVLPAQPGCPTRNAHSVPASPVRSEKRLYLTADGVAAKYVVLHAAKTVSFPTRPCVDHVFRFLGALLSSRRFPGNSILSCCSYSVVGAYRLIETGEGPLVS